VFAFEGGNGSSSNPYEISNCKQLQSINASNSFETSYELINNIDCSNTVDWNSGKGFKPIGNGTNRFKGRFNGNNYIIKHLYIDRPTKVEVGLFGHTGYKSNIANLSLRKVTIIGDIQVGSLAGDATKSDIDSVSATGNVKNGGGTGGDQNGGLVGRHDRGTINNSYTNVDVTGGDDIGGFIGESGSDSIIRNSYSLGNVSTSADKAALFAAVNRGDTENIYATGSLSGGFQSGGLIGFNAGNINDGYWNTEVSGFDTSDGGTGLPTSNMTGNSAPSNMSGLDFTNTWESVEASDSDTVEDGYPIIQSLDRTYQLGARGISYPPEFDSESVIPDSFYIDDSLSYSAYASDPNTNIQNISLTVYQDGSQVYSDTVSSSSNTWSDVYSAQEGKIEAEFTATDDAGASTTETITRTLSESSPVSPTINSPDGSEKNVEEISYDVSTSSDGDDNLGESLTVTVFEDGVQVGQHTGVTEGNSVSGSYTSSNTGTHTFEAKVTEEDDSQTASSSVSYDVSNFQPKISGVEFIDDRQASVTDLNFTLNDEGEQDISDFNGLTSSKVFSNSTLRSAISLPFSSTVNVTDSSGVSSGNLELDLSESESDISQSNSFQATEDAQRIEKTVNISNNVDESIDYELMTDLEGTAVQGQTFTGSISGNSKVSETSVTESDWITQSYSSLKEDNSSQHDLQSQYVFKRKNLTNSGQYNFSSVNVTDPVSDGDEKTTGICRNCGTRNPDIGGYSTVSEDYNFSVEWIENQGESSYRKYSASSFNHTVSGQKIVNQTQLYLTNTASAPHASAFKLHDVNISSTCGRTSLVDVPPASFPSTVTTDCNRVNYTGDWIASSSSSEKVDESYSHDVDSQGLYKSKSLTEEGGYNWSDVSVPAPDLSGSCVNCGLRNVDLSNGSTRTEYFNSTGDWIENEKNQSTQYVSGDVILGDGISSEYTARQDVEVTNVRSSESFQVDLGKLVSDIPGCSLQNSSTQSVPADSVSSFDFQKSCNPGQHINRTPVRKTETSDSFKYEIEFGFEINSNVTDEKETEYAVKSDWVDNWNSRDPTETEAVVDGSGKDIEVDERIIDGTEYIIFQIGDNHTNSSIHTGTHSASLTYYESKETGSTSGGGSTSTGGGSLLVGGSSETTVDENNGSRFSWSVSAITSSDAQSFQIQGYPGDTFEKYVVVRNRGDSNVTLDISCVSESGACSYVDTSVDRVVLNRNSFSEKEVKVSGRVPVNVSEFGDRFSFGIRVTDPDWNGTSSSSESVSFVDFTVSNSPFVGRALDAAFKVVEVRTFESPFEEGSDLPYPFIFVPLFWAVLAWTGISLGEWLVADRKYSNLKIGVTLLVFLVLFLLL